MSQKIYISLGILILLIVGAVYYSSVISQPAGEKITEVVPPGAPPTPNGSSVAPQPSTVPSPVTTPAPPSSTGERVVFAVTDKAASLTGMSSVIISVENLWVRHEKLGWREVSLGSPKSYNLLELSQNGTLKLLQDARLPAGNYTEVHLRLGAALTVIPNVGSPQTARLLSPDIKFAGRFSAKSKDTAVVYWDFLLDKSLHVTTGNSYIFAPVVRFQSRNDAIVEITSKQNVKVGGGSSSFTMDVGIDENGTLKQNYALGLLHNYT